MDKQQQPTNDPAAIASERATTRQTPKSRFRQQAIDLAEQQIESCEPRLALSASLAAEILLESLDVQIASVAEPATDSASGNQADVQATSGAMATDGDAEPFANLIDQANEVRAPLGLDGSGQTVAIIDSGIAWDHIALGGGYGPGYRVVGGWDFAEDDANPYDDGPAGFHGSHIAGLIAGDAEGFEGVAPGADLVGLRVFDDHGASELQWIESALQWVHDNQDSFESPITTVNLSVGAALSDDNRAEATAMLADELQQLRDDQILVFAAAGNFFGSSQADGDNQILFPASDPNVVAVSSVGSDGSLSDFAQREDGIIATQGESVRSSVPDHVFGWDGKVDDFAALDGTSMATPQVAAASMVIRQAMIEQGLEPTADEILARLNDSARSHVDSVTGETYQTVDLANAVRSTTDVETNLTPPTTIDQFAGSSESEHVELDLTDGIKMRIGDRVYDLQPNDAGDPLVIDVGNGADSIQIVGSDAAERLALYPVSASDTGDGQSSRLSTSEFEIELRGFENVAFDGGGGRDRATLYDSTGNDRLESGPGSARLSGVGFQFDVSNVNHIYVHATNGGSDSAYLNDSPGDDSLAVRPQFTSLRTDQTFQLAYGFERVNAYATSGGDDTAKIYDSSGDDTMSVSASRTMIAGPNYQVTARGFDSVIGHANAGGDDVAKIYGDPTSNQWHSTDDMVQWTGQDNAVRVARGFERTTAFENYQPISLQPLSLTSLMGADDDEREALV
ncbi:MAG: S8 family serine peptidase, partial [Pirellulaceae bacterium]|nr:S8 family serine peptidase [Pirellulaceae bacterium]